MTPKEHANKLFWKFYHIVDRDSAKQCALIAVDEICEAINWHELDKPNKEWDYWNEVKQEIQNL